MVGTNNVLVDDDKDAYDGPGTMDLSGRHQYRHALLAPTSRDGAGRLVRMCSWCKTLERNQTWVIKEAIEEADLLDALHLSRITHTICANCYCQLMKDIGTALREGSDRLRLVRRGRRSARRRQPRLTTKSNRPSGLKRHMPMSERMSHLYWTPAEPMLTRERTHADNRLHPPPVRVGEPRTRAYKGSAFAKRPDASPTPAPIRTDEYRPREKVYDKLSPKPVLN